MARATADASFRLPLALLAAWLAMPAAAAAAPPAARTGSIYSCVLADGRRLTSDRPIAECAAREQRLLNADGSLKRIVPPTLTADERIVRDAEDRRAAGERAAQAEAVRRDRNLMQRYPSETAHRRAREAALDTVRLAIKAADARLRDLAVERKPLTDEAEFYVGRVMPLKLKTQLDANDAAVEAQRAVAANQQAELDRITGNFDLELERLRKLWGGAAPGSLGPLQQASASRVAGDVPAGKLK